MNKIDFADVLIKIIGVAGFFFSLSLIPMLIPTIFAMDRFTSQSIIGFIFAVLMWLTLIRYSYKLSTLLFKSNSTESEQSIDVKNNKDNFLFWVKLIGLVIIIISISPLVSAIYVLLVPSANFGKVVPHSLIFYLIKPALGFYLLLDGSFIVKIAYPKSKEVEQEDQ